MCLLRRRGGLASEEGYFRPDLSRPPLGMLFQFVPPSLILPPSSATSCPPHLGARADPPFAREPSIWGTKPESQPLKLRMSWQRVGLDRDVWLPSPDSSPLLPASAHACEGKRSLASAENWQVSQLGGGGEQQSDFQTAFGPSPGAASVQHPNDDSLTQMKHLYRLPSRQKEATEAKNRNNGICKRADTAHLKKKDTPPKR